MRRSSLPLFLLVLAAPVQGADEKVEPKFDKPFKQHWTTTVRQTLTIKGKEPVTQTQEVRLGVVWTPEKGEDKTVQMLKLKIDSLTLSATAGKEKVTFDSAKPADATNPLDSALRKLVGAEIGVKLKLPELTPELSGVEDLLKDVPEQQQKDLESFVSKDALTRAVTAALPALPDKDKKTSKTDGKFTVANLGSYETTTEITYDKAVDKLVSYKTKTSWKFQPAEEGKGPFQVKELNPPTAELTGEIVFDTGLGRLQKSTLECKAPPKPAALKVVIGKNTVEAVLAQDYTYTVEGVEEK
jgi:hypothetical protein